MTFNEDANDFRRVSDLFTRQQHLEMEPAPPRAVRDPYAKGGKGLRLAFRAPVNEGHELETYEQLQVFRSALPQRLRFRATDTVLQRGRSTEKGDGKRVRPPSSLTPPPPSAAVRMPAEVRMPACHSRRFKGERPIGAATG